MADIIYKIKEEVDYNKLGEIGWSVIPSADGKLMFLKFSVQPKDGELVNLLLKNYYNNPEWKKIVYYKAKKGFTDKIGLRYNKKGEIIPNKKFEKALTHWIMEISEEDGWVGFSSFDPFDLKVYYGKPILDKYCSEEINLLKENDLIEEYEVTE